MPFTETEKRRYPVLASLLASLVVAAVLLGLFSLYIRNLQEDQGSQLFTRLEGVINDVYDTLIPLNALGHATCSEVNIRAMEAAQFNAVYPRQIMFYIDGAGVCSTGSGILDEPVRRPPPDFNSPTTGAEVWVNREIILDLTGEPFVAIIFKQGNYSVLLDPAVIDLPGNTLFDWEILFRDLETPGRYVHIHGTENLRRPSQESADRNFYYHELCADERPYLCVVQTTSMASIISEYSASIFLLALLSLALGNVAGYQFHLYQHRQEAISTRVLNGFRNKAFYWHYQPIIDMEQNHIIGCEVLSRFSDHYGDALPDDYLPALRDAGLTAEFTRLMFSTVLSDLDRQPALPDGFKVSVNIFPADIISGAINDIIRMEEIRSSRFTIALEITEEEYLDEIGGQNSLENIHESGLAISIDDFGTGYSNLKQLKKLNCSYLKIDRSYIADLEDEPIKSSLIPHIVNMADQLDLSVIAEGIETFEQEVILVGLGVRYGQGNFFGKPMSSDALVAHIASHLIGNSGQAIILDD